MKPHHHQIVGATRFLESELDRLIINRASCIMGFSTELKERLCKRPVSVKQCVFCVMVELDCSQFDEVVDRACGFQTLVNSVNKVGILHSIKLGSRDHELCTDNGNHLAMNARFEGAVAMDIFCN